MAPPATTAEAAAFALRRSRGDRGQPGRAAGPAAGHGGTMVEPWLGGWGFQYPLVN